MTHVFSIDGSGDCTCPSTFSNGSGSYLYPGNLRLGEFETGNSIWNANNNMGLTVNSGYYVSIGVHGGNGY